MHDAGHRGDHAEITKCLLSPFQEFIAFAVALEFDFGISLKRISSREEINLDGMIDDEINRHKRIDLLRVAAETGNGRAHRS